MIETKRIAIAKPPMGAKAWVLQERGVYVLEEMPGNLLHFTCTHAGSGGVHAYDGAVVDGKLVGRKLLHLSPTAMGVWHLNAGFQNGLVIENIGAAGQGGGLGAPSYVNSPFATIVWQTRNQPTASATTRKSKALVQGRQVLTEKDCILYELLLTNAGAGSVRLLNGKGRLLYECPSVFRGSFLLEHVFCDGGLVAELHSSQVLNIEAVWLE
jgi:hypothetical protein